METLSANLPYLLRGARVTILLFVASFALGTIIGVGAGVLASLRHPMLRGIVAAYVFITRGIPLLVHLFLVYYLLPALGLDLDPYVGATLVLALYIGAFISEVTRGAIGSVSRGQVDAALSLGMTRARAMRKIVLPQAVRYFLPPYIGNAVMLVKLTSVVSVINIWELTLAGREVVERTLAPFQIFAGVALIYFVICYALSLSGRAMERRIQFGQLT